MPFRKHAIRTAALALVWVVATAGTWQATHSPTWTLVAAALCRYLDAQCGHQSDALLPVHMRYPGSTAV